MKNYIQEMFKKGRYKEKQVFLFSNIAILVIVMAFVWGSYDINTGTLTFPPNANADVINSTQTTNPTENTTQPTVNPTTQPTVNPTTQPTTPNEWPKYHIVEQTDTWYSICMKYFNTDEYADAIAFDNNRSIVDYIIIGESIKVESEQYLIELATNIRANNSNNEVYIFSKGPFGYTYGERPNPAIDIIVDKDCQGKNYTEEVDTSTFKFVGNHVITGYDPHCSHCCSGIGLTASGNYAINGYSVAAKYPIGTTLYINGYGFYVVEDTGVSGRHIDIAAPSHEACYDLTSNSVAVYIVPNNN